MVSALLSDAVSGPSPPPEPEPQSRHKRLAQVRPEPPPVKVSARTRRRVAKWMGRRPDEAGRLSYWLGFESALGTAGLPAPAGNGTEWVHPASARRWYDGGGTASAFRTGAAKTARTHAPHHARKEGRTASRSLQARAAKTEPPFTENRTLPSRQHYWQNSARPERHRPAGGGNAVVLPPLPVLFRQTPAWSRANGNANDPMVA